MKVAENIRTEQLHNLKVIRSSLTYPTYEDHHSSPAQLLEALDQNEGSDRSSLPAGSGGSAFGSWGRSHDRERGCRCCSPLGITNDYSLTPSVSDTLPDPLRNGNLDYDRIFSSL